MIERNTYNELFEQIRNNNAEAFNTLYAQFFAPLCVFASRYISDHNIIEDCVQDVFLKIWKDKENINITTSIRSYLLTATKNNCLNLIEKKKTEQTYEQYILNTYDEYSSSDLYSVEEIERLITQAINKLPEKYRTVFQMSRFENLTYKEIAVKQNISIKTVEAYMHKSLIILQIALKDYLPIIGLLLFLKKM